MNKLLGFAVLCVLFVHATAKPQSGLEALAALGSVGKVPSLQLSQDRGTGLLDLPGNLLEDIKNTLTGGDKTKVMPIPMGGGSGGSSSSSSGGCGSDCKSSSDCGSDCKSKSSSCGSDCKKSCDSC